MIHPTPNGGVNFLEYTINLTRQHSITEHATEEEETRSHPEMVGR